MESKHMGTSLHNIGKTVVILALVVFTGCTMDSVTLNRQAQVYINHGQYAEAKTLLEKSVKIDYENSPSHYWLGQCYQAQGNQENAVWEYGIAVRFDPTMEIAQMAYIRGLHDLEQEDKSVEATEKFLTYKDAPTDYFMQLGKTFLELNMPQQGVLAYLAAARTSPGNAVPFIIIADYFFDKGDNEKGVEYLTQGFKTNPVHPGLAQRLGQLGLRVDIPQPKLFHHPSKLERELVEINK
jgi:tetratricopeptide (TPR) repeat protein